MDGLNNKPVHAVTNCRQTMQYIDTKDPGQWQFVYMYRLCLDNQIVYKSSDYVFKTASLSDVTTYTRYACSRSIIPKMNSLNSDLIMYLYFLEAS